MADTVYQYEIKVSLPNEQNPKATIPLSPNGDIQLVDKQDKLIIQLARSIINKNTFLADSTLNAKINTNSLQTLLSTVIGKFKTNQVVYVNSYESDLSGFAIYRKAAGSNEDYVRISGRAVTYSFTDTDVFNNTTYRYGISKIYNNISESKYIDILEVTPSSRSKDQTIAVGTSSVILTGNSQNTIYVCYNRKHRATELIQDILGVDVLQDQADPRKYAVGVKVVNMKDEKLGISTFHKTVQ